MLVRNLVHCRLYLFYRLLYLVITVYWKKKELKKYSDYNVTGRAAPALLMLTQDHRIKVLPEPCELQLSVCDLIQSDPQQAVVMKLAQVMYTW